MFIGRTINESTEVQPTVVNEIETFVTDIQKKTETSASNIKTKYNSEVKPTVEPTVEPITTTTTTLDPKTTVSPTPTTK